MGSSGDRDDHGALCPVAGCEAERGSSIHKWRAVKLSSIEPALTHLNATLTSRLTSVDSKQLTANLNHPESTLTKNMGEGGVIVNQISHEESVLLPQGLERRRSSTYGLCKNWPNVPLLLTLRKD